MQRQAFLALAALAVLFCAQCASAPRPESARWWRGNLHTHSLWTDGTDFPEMIADWYVRHGYNFLAITEHDMLQEGERVVDMTQPDPGWPPRNASARAAFPGYLERFGPNWVQYDERDGKRLVRLRPLSEYRHLFERPDSFLFIMAEEITDRQGAHVNAFNLEVAIQPRGGSTTAERTRRNLAAVHDQREGSGRMISAVINHPNYVWSLNADAIANLEHSLLFEVYNGHLLTNNAGDSTHLSTDAMWDEILAQRHRAGRGPVYGVATDDAHDYRSFSDTISMPGRGWVMVRTRALRTEELLRALEAGDFYASTGVMLDDVRHDDRGIRLRIKAQDGVNYRTRFIGTRVNGPTGEVLKEVTGTEANYTFTGDERYVRAVIISDKRKLDVISGKELGFEQAWIQPVWRAVR